MARLWLLSLLAGFALSVLPVLVEPAEAQPFGTLKCRGPAKFSATASFTWTRNDQPIGTPTNFACTDSGQDGPRSVGPKPPEANDWKVRIQVTDPPVVEQLPESFCEGDQGWAPDNPAPPRFRIDCFLPGGGKAIFKITP